MTKLDSALLHTMRLGLRGDTKSLRSYAKKIIRDSKNIKGSEDLRSGLSKLIIDDSSQSLRQAQQKNVFRNTGGLVSVHESVSRPSPVLDDPTSEMLFEILRERKNGPRRRLQKLDLEPSRTLLLFGPPGVGKTMAAYWLAAELKLPLLIMDLAMVVSSFLGGSGQNIRSVLEFSKTSPCVLFLDEFDAIAKKRNDPSDVGELKRIVNVLLLELDTWPSTGLLIAATNLPDLLDRAVWRRFDQVTELKLPGEKEREKILNGLLNQIPIENLDKNLRPCVEVTKNCSGSDINNLVKAYVRHNTVRNEKLTGDSMFKFFVDRTELKEKDNEAYCYFSMHELNKASREVGTELGISHVAVTKRAKKYEERKHVGQEKNGSAKATVGKGGNTKRTRRKTKERGA